nr:glycosyltransferase [Modestobacter versicolor]
MVPAYQPDARLLALVDGLRTAAPEAHLLVVDDGSGPGYAPVFDAARQRGCTVLGHPVNQGKGAALKTGFRFVAEHAPGQEVVCADSDGQHSPDDVLRVAARVRDGADLVLGVRGFTGAVPLRSRFGNALTRALLRLATGRDVRDTQTGLRGYAAELLPWLLTVPGERFEYEVTTLLQAVRRGLPVDQVDIATIYLEGNASSHFRPVLDSARIYAPLLAFLASSFAAFLLDAGALVVLHALVGGLLLPLLGARLLSSCVNFAVNRSLVFAAPGARSVRAAAVRYASLAVVLLAGNYLLLAVLTRLGLGLLPAKVLTEVLLVAASYLGQRRSVYVRRVRARQPTRREPAPVG